MEDQMDDQAMMEAMGFSSFGMQKPPNKKRKYNPNADASIEKSNSPKYSSSGANSTPLGAPAPRLAAPEPTNTNEISLEDDDDDDDDDQNKAAGNGGASLGDANAVASTLPTQVPASLPARPAQGAGFGGQGPRGQHGGHAGHGAGRDDGHIWYDGYYDHFSNENPWRELEKRMGLKPLSAWPVVELPTGPTGPTAPTPAS